MKSAVRILIFASLASMGIVSCNSSDVEEACREQLPALNEQLHQIHEQIAQYAPDNRADRAIASDSQKGSQPGSEPANRVVDLPPDVKTVWQNWSEKRLVEVERYADFVRTRSQFRAALEPLTEIANELVKFDGYVDQGKAYQAMESLHRAQLNADAVARATCAPAPTSSAR
jgi:hypothetical protein